MFVHRYVAAARWLHWIVAVLVIGTAIGGIWLTQFEPPDGPFKDALYMLHKSFGVTIFALVLLRLVVRWSNPPPPLPSGTPGWVRGAAAVSHGSLYALLVLMPIIGFLGNSAGGYGLVLFDVLPIPSPLAKDDALSEWLFTLHWAGGIALVALFAGHLLGTFYHVAIRRDGLLRRMA